VRRSIATFTLTLSLVLRPDLIPTRAVMNIKKLGTARVNLPAHSAQRCSCWGSVRELLIRALRWAVANLEEKGSIFLWQLVLRPTLEPLDSEHRKWRTQTHAAGRGLCLYARHTHTY
jgi:hypothetical protein